MDEKYIGEVVDGRYRLDDLLGEGAMGAVYSGNQLAVDRRVAVKLLHPFLQRNKDFKARFELEARALARLSHPNCITLFDFGYCDELEIFYMVLEFVEGDVLADWLVDRVAYSDAIQIAFRVALALEHAHGQGILHRDLKPENIMVSRDASGALNVKVLDFGLARLLVSEDVDEEPTQEPGTRQRRLTKAGEIYGTPAYMSPEQCRGSRDLSESSDLYALGVMLFELIENRLPFFADSPAEIMVKQLSDPAPKVKAEIDDDIRMLVEWMLRKEPLERPANAGQVLDVLRRYAVVDGSLEVSVATGDYARPSGAVSQEHESIASDQERRPALSISLVVALFLGVLVAGGLIVWAISDSPDSTTEVVEAEAQGRELNAANPAAAEQVEPEPESEPEEMADEVTEAGQALEFDEFEVDLAFDDEMEPDAAESPGELEEAASKPLKSRSSRPKTSPRRPKIEPEEPRKLKLTY